MCLCLVYQLIRSNFSCLNNDRRKYIFSRYSSVISTAVVNLMLLLLLSPYESSQHWIFISINTHQLHGNFPFVMSVAEVLVVSLFFLSFLLPSPSFLIPTENKKSFFNCGFHSIQVSFNFDFDYWWVENNNFYLVFEIVISLNIRMLSIILQYAGFGILCFDSMLSFGGTFLEPMMASFISSSNDNFWFNL